MTKSINYKYISESNISDIPLDTPIFFDIETDGLYINPSLIQIIWGQEDTVRLYRVQPDKDPIFQKLISHLTECHLVIHNSSYDLGTLNFTPRKLDDTLFASRLSMPHLEKFSLDIVAQEFGANYYTGIDKKAMQKAKFKVGEDYTPEQLEYACADVLALRDIYNSKTIQKCVTGSGVYRLDIENQLMAIKYQQNGMMVNQDKIRNIHHEVKEKLITSLQELKELVKCELNVNSPKQVKEFFNTASSDRKTMLKLNTPESVKVLEVRGLRKEEQFLYNLKEFDRVLTRFSVAGAITGRFTSKGGDIPNGYNLQNIPRKYQKFLNEDLGDTVVISLDYSALELRLACAIYGEPVMREQFLSGEDLHYAMGQALTGKDEITKDERTLAKIINFGLIYGMGISAFQDYAFTNFGVVIDEDEARRFKQIYFNKYRHIKRYHSVVFNTFVKGQYEYRTALGRKVRPNRTTEALNGIVQGSGVECIKIALIYMRDKFAGASEAIYNVIHDAIYLRVPKADKEYWEKALMESMAYGWDYVIKSDRLKYNDIPMPLEFD